MTQLSPLQSAILAALRQGDRNQGALLDETGAGSYPELNAALKKLVDAGAISHYFTETAPPILVYQIKNSAPHWLRRI